MTTIVADAVVVGSPAGKVGSDTEFTSLLSARFHTVVVQKALLVHSVVQGELAARVPFNGGVQLWHSEFRIGLVLPSMGILPTLDPVPSLDVGARVVRRFVVVASGRAAPDGIFFVIGIGFQIMWPTSDGQEFRAFPPDFWVCDGVVAVAAFAIAIVEVDALCPVKVGAVSVV